MFRIYVKYLQICDNSNRIFLNKLFIHATFFYPYWKLKRTYKDIDW